MQVQVEILKDLERKMRISVPTSVVNEKLTLHLKNLARKVKVSGFRPGKAPMNMVIKNYKDSAYQDVIKDVIHQSFRQALMDQKLRIVGFPEFETETHIPEKDVFSFHATFEIYPEITIKDLSKKQLDKPIFTVTAKDLKKTIEALRKQHTQFMAVERAAQKEDRVTIDFDGKIDGKSFPGGQANDFSLILDQGMTLPEFESSLLGMEKGNTCTAKVPFPKDYHNSSIAGKTAAFTITLKEVTAPKLPEINEAFAQQLGIPGGLNNLEEAIKKHLNKEVERRLWAKTKQNIVNMLLDAVPVNLPKYLVKQEVARLSQEAQKDMAQHTQQNTQLPDKIFQKSAERNVAVNIIFGEIIQTHQLKADPDALLAVITSIAENYEHKQKIIDWYYEDRNRLSGAIALVLEDEVVKWVLSQTQVVEKKMTFDEIMGATPAINHP